MATVDKKSSAYLSPVDFEICSARTVNINIFLRIKKSNMAAGEFAWEKTAVYLIVQV